jgi:hypothetical protein
MKRQQRCCEPRWRIKMSWALKRSLLLLDRLRQQQLPRSEAQVRVCGGIHTRTTTDAGMRDRSMSQGAARCRRADREAREAHVCSSSWRRVACENVS